jgi:hypothetical protein
MAKAGDKSKTKPRLLKLDFGPYGLFAEQRRRPQRLLEIAFSAAAPANKAAPKKRRRVVEGPQDGRIKIKLVKLFPGGRVPSDKELSNAELAQMVVNEFKKDPKIPGLGIPHPKTILRVAGRIPRKK